MIDSNKLEHDVVRKPLRTFRHHALSAGAAAAVIAALFLSACTTTGQPTLASAPARGPTVTFESIDGPPESVYQRLVQTLSDEAEIRQLAVVSRAEVAQYRIRSYLSAQTHGRRSTVAWVWDVYDANQRRALRISGEEPTSAAGAGTWAIADDQVLRRVAYNGMDRLVAFMQAPPSDAGPPAIPPAPSERVASANGDLAPEAAGISPLADATTVSAAAPGAVPLPRRRPLDTGSAQSMAYLDTER